VLVLALLPAAAAANYAHVIQPGETLTSIARIDGLSIAALARANGLSSQARLIAGQTLWIPPREGAVQTTSTTASASGADADADGDRDTTVTAPTKTTTAPVPTQTTTATSGTGAPVPTPQFVSSGEIATVATANGVPAALAEAIAWQESGWNNAEVSNAGAVGVMQIVPDTWTWIDRYLTPSDPLGTASASENIRAGVLLLRQLLEITGGNERLAVAGYFQGLASIRRFGMYRSTRRYVADVLALAQRY
jgi:murein DD-endopeptidase MepM/ murein hydrolase activator NlpD